MSPTAESEPKPKAPRLDEDSINTEECCACFGLYIEDIGTGREWMECACGRWIHEECVEDIVYDANGKEKLCPLIPRSSTIHINFLLFQDVLQILFI